MSKQTTLRWTRPAIPSYYEAYSSFASQETPCRECDDSQPVLQGSARTPKQSFEAPHPRILC